MKVYCRDCKHWAGRDPHYGCISPNNMKDTFFAPKSEPILAAEEKNDNNDCHDYDPAVAESEKGGLLKNVGEISW